jgi:hypothetical protein
MNEVVSLIDPVSRVRIATPARSKVCKHPQCFDLLTFLSMHQYLAAGLCCVCHKVIQMSELIIDGLFQDILKNTTDEETVELHPDGSWNVRREEDIPNSDRKRKRESNNFLPQKIIVTDLTSSPIKPREDSIVIDLTLDDD